MPERVAGGERPLQVFSRPGCHLCEVLLEELLPLTRGRRQVVVLDVSSRADWEAEYGTRIPVVKCNGEVICQYTLDVAAIQRVLAHPDGS